MRENIASFWKKDKKIIMHATGFPILIAGLKHMLDRNIDYLRDFTDVRKIHNVLDVGANLGFVTLQLNYAFPNAKILAIEPSSHNLKYLKLNVGDIENIEIIPVAAAAENCELEIALPTSEQRSDVILQVEDFYNTGTISVYGESNHYREKVVGKKLDDIANRPVDYMKIDIEGYELEALKGAQKILIEDKPYIQIELRATNQNMAGLEIKDVHDYLKSFGYIRIGTFEGDALYMHEDKDIIKVNRVRIKRLMTAPNDLILSRFDFHINSIDIEFLKNIRQVKKIETIYDIGACVGVMSVLFRLTFKDAIIYALEPAEINYKYLKKNLAYFQGIYPYKVAASNLNGKIKIALPTKNQRPEIEGASEKNPALISVYGKSDIYSEIVNCVKLDNYARTKADLIKIDAEGHEFEVLEGAHNLLFRDRPIIFLNPRMGTQKMAGRNTNILFDKMESYDYKNVGHYKGDAIFFPVEIIMGKQKIESEDGNMLLEMREI